MASYEALGRWRAAGREWLEPVIDEDWTTDPWWTKDADPAAPYSFEFWRLLDTGAERYYDTERWRSNPLFSYRDARPGS